MYSPCITLYTFVTICDTLLRFVILCYDLLSTNLEQIVTICNLLIYDTIIFTSCNTFLEFVILCNGWYFVIIYDTLLHYITICDLLSMYMNDEMNKRSIQVPDNNGSHIYSQWTSSFFYWWHIVRQNTADNLLSYSKHFKCLIML